MDSGIYALVFANTPSEIRIGALGPCGFSKGWHVYVGSAQGTGGLKRVIRHIRIANNKAQTPKWHIDYLLMNPRFSLVYTVCGITQKILECRLARSLKGALVPGFGCSDCTCPSHLLYYPENPVRQVSTAFTNLGITPHIKTIMSSDVEGTKRRGSTP